MRTPTSHQQVTHYRPVAALSFDASLARSTPLTPPTPAPAFINKAPVSTAKSSSYTPQALPQTARLPHSLAPQPSASKAPTPSSANTALTAKHTLPASTHISPYVKNISLREPLSPPEYVDVTLNPSVYRSLKKEVWTFDDFFEEVKSLESDSPEMMQRLYDSYQEYVYENDPNFTNADMIKMNLIFNDYSKWKNDNPHLTIHHYTAELLYMNALNGASF